MTLFQAAPMVYILVSALLLLIGKTNLEAVSGGGMNDRLQFTGQSVNCIYFKRHVVLKKTTGNDRMIERWMLRNTI